MEKDESHITSRNRVNWSLMSNSYSYFVANALDLGIKITHIPQNLISVFTKITFNNNSCLYLTNYHTMQNNHHGKRCSELNGSFRLEKGPCCWSFHGYAYYFSFSSLLFSFLDSVKVIGGSLNKTKLSFCAVQHFLKAIQYTLVIFIFILNQSISTVIFFCEYI